MYMYVFINSNARKTLNEYNQLDGANAFSYARDRSHADDDRFDLAAKYLEWAPRDSHVTECVCLAKMVIVCGVDEA